MTTETEFQRLMGKIDDLHSECLGSLEITSDRLDAIHKSTLDVKPFIMLTALMTVTLALVVAALTGRLG